MEDFEVDKIVDTLSSSFEKQCSFYRALAISSRKAAGALAVSRGDFTSLMPLFAEKETLLANIQNLQNSVQTEMSLWQSSKQLAPRELVEKINAKLDALEMEIKLFLVSEKQLEKQILFYQKGDHGRE